eukprot:3371525-Rhodomonas_salina.1
MLRELQNTRTLRHFQARKKGTFGGGHARKTCTRLQQLYLRLRGPCSAVQIYSERRQKQYLKLWGSYKSTEKGGKRE